MVLVINLSQKNYRPFIFICKFKEQTTHAREIVFLPVLISLGLMDNELKTCIAAVFLNKGKDVLTAKEFAMYVSLDLRWMPVKDSYNLIAVLSEKKMINVSGDYLRPAVDLSSVSVPVAYRPDEKLLKMLNSYKASAKTVIVGSEELFPQLINVAVNSGANKGKFVSECNRISKTLNVDMEVAAMLALRELNVDISLYLDTVSEQILSR